MDRSIGFCHGCGKIHPPAFAGSDVQQERFEYSEADWKEYNTSGEGQTSYCWWATWIPTPEGQTWVANKRWEARVIVDGIISSWGLNALRAGAGVIDVGGDPGFLAAELLRSGIHVTVIDPGFGYSGKSDAATSAHLEDPRHCNFVRPGVVPFRIIRRPFTQSFLEDPENRRLVSEASAILSLYPDDATDFLIEYSASTSKRTALIPCNECVRFFPPENPTYEAFVDKLLADDYRHCMARGKTSCLQRRNLLNAPFCRVLLERLPVQDNSYPSLANLVVEGNLHSQAALERNSTKRRHDEATDCIVSKVPRYE